MHLEKLAKIAEYAKEILSVIDPEDEYEQLNDEDGEDIEKAFIAMTSLYDSVLRNDARRDSYSSHYIDLDHEKMYMEAKMDPVGKDDADINNDGKVDSEDDYLHRRRKAISSAMKNRKK